MPFPEISLDDLALEFFSSSSKNDNESDGGVVEGNGREGRSVSRRAEIGRWASDTASSRRRGRSVSRARGNVVSSNSASAKNVISSDAGSRRRRSLSVARYQISDSESEVDHSQNSRNRAYVKAPISGSNQMSLAPMGTTSNNRRLARSRSHKDLSLLHDGYSSHSSALTDEESKDTHFGKNGYEKIIRQFMLRRRTSLEAEKYAPKFEQEQRGQVVSKMVKELPHSRTSAIAEKPSRGRKRSSDRSRTSKRLIEEAERIFEDFLSNVEDTDISSLDGERSDGSSSFGGMMKARAAAIMEAETYRTPAGSAPPVEMDGVILPWLQWETSHDGSLSGKNKALTPMTPKALEWNSEKDSDLPPFMADIAMLVQQFSVLNKNFTEDMVLLHDPSSHSVSSQGSSSPALFNSPFMDKREETCKSRQVGNDCLSCFDMDEYLNLQNNEELLFEMYRERNRINSGVYCFVLVPLLSSQVLYDFNKSLWYIDLLLSDG
ncbi:UNVERIFIED_CONTAM: hypothetical protein Sangu_0083000 [Sesamum angustifolium]|uniref:Uncharacterized protein n=1 Tax=Sesamum angustifolium TaxID=2727405 RepID=A0AAW2RIZ6_9LAMI